MISLSLRVLTGGFYNFLQDLHENSGLALKLLGLGLKLLSPIEEFGQFGHVEGSPLLDDRVQDLVGRALPRQRLSDLSDRRLIGSGRIKLVSRSQCDPDTAVFVEAGDAGGDWRCASDNLGYARNRLGSLNKHAILHALLIRQKTILVVNPV